MSVLIRIISVLLVIVVLQVYLDETIEHYHWNGKPANQNTHALSSVNDNLQQNHDHLWMFSSKTGFGNRTILPVVLPGICAYVALPDLIIPIWQPPKLL